MDQFNPLILKGSKTYKCSKCDGIFFKPEYILQVVSKFKVGAPTDIVVPLSIHRCTECGTPIEQEFEMITGLIAEMPGSPESDNVRSIKKNTGLITS